MTGVRATRELAPPAPEAGRSRADRRRILAIGAYVGVAFLAAGVIAMAATEIGPLSADQPSLYPARVAADVLALHPAGLIWVGILVAVATPAARLAASPVGYLRGRAAGWQPSRS